MLVLEKSDADGWVLIPVSSAGEANPYIGSAYCAVTHSSKRGWGGRHIGSLSYYIAGIGDINAANTCYLIPQ